MEERTTSELIHKLGDDVQKCSEMFLEPDAWESLDDRGNFDGILGFYARSFVRTAFSYIESVTYSVKVCCISECMDMGIEISDHERYLAVEISADLNDKGEIIERSPKIRLPSNVRFAIKLMEKRYGKSTGFSPNDEWWTCFREIMKLRDRLMHPRLPEDIDISGDEIMKTLKAVQGFEKVFMSLE